MRRSQAVDRIRELSRPLEPLPVPVQARVARIPGLRAVLFDVYGTLLVSASGEVGSASKTGAGGGTPPGTEDPLERALRMSGLEPRPLPRSGVELIRERILERHAASRERGIEHPEVDIREVFRDLMVDLAGCGVIPGSSASDPDGIERLALDYECLTNPTAAMPGAAETLRALSGLGFLLGIVSNAQSYTPLVLEAQLGAPLEELGLDRRLCVWSYEHGEAKPSGLLHRIALGALRDGGGIRPLETLYVGNDMRNDVLASSASGMHTAIFAGDSRSYRPRAGDPACAGLSPELIVTELSQLPAALG